MRIGSLTVQVLAVMVVVLAALLNGYAQSQSSPRFRLELRFPNGGTWNRFVELHEPKIRPEINGMSVVSSSTDASGTSVYHAFLISQFDAESILPNAVVLRFRLKWVEGTSNMDEVLKKLAVANLQEAMAKVPWRTLTYTPGRVEEIRVDGTVLKMSGSALFDLPIVSSSTARSHR